MIAIGNQELTAASESRPGCRVDPTVAAAIPDEQGDEQRQPDQDLERETAKRRRGHRDTADCRTEHDQIAALSISLVPLRLLAPRTALPDDDGVGGNDGEGDDRQLSGSVNGGEVGAGLPATRRRNTSSNDRQREEEAQLASFMCSSTRRLATVGFCTTNTQHPQRNRPPWSSTDPGSVGFGRG